MAIEGGYGSAAQFNQMANAAQQATVHVGKLVQQLALIQATTATVSMTVRSFSQLELVLTQTQAVAEGTTKEFKQMEKAVRDYALATRFSAAESTLALYNLASAGLTIQQSLKAMGATLELAQATMSDVGMSADTLASTLAAFNLSADQASRVSNTMVASINKSQASIEKLAFSYRQVAPVAHAMNNSFEETTAALSILYNQGLRGEQAGTALRNAMVRLANPTDKAKEALYDMGIASQSADGKVRKLKDILADLSKVNPATSTLKNIVDDEALAGTIALLNASSRDEYLKKLQKDADFAQYAEGVMSKLGKTAKDAANALDLMEKDISGTNAAAETSMKMMLTLSGSFSQANNAVTELAISMGQTVAPALRAVAGVVADLGIAFRGLNDTQRQQIVSLPILAAGAYATVKAFQALAGPVAMLAGLGKGAASGKNPISTIGAVGAFASSVVGNARDVFSFNPNSRAAAGAMSSINPSTSLARGPGGRMLGATASAYDPSSAFLLSQGMTRGLDSSKFATSSLALLGRSVAALGMIGASVAVLTEIYGLLKDTGILGGNRNAAAVSQSVDVGEEFSRRAKSIALTASNYYDRDQQLDALYKQLIAVTKDQIDQRSVSTKMEEQYAASISSFAISKGGSGQNMDMKALTGAFYTSGGQLIDLKNSTAAGYAKSQVGQALGLSTNIFGAYEISDEQLQQLQQLVEKWSQANQNIKVLDKNVANVVKAGKEIINLQTDARQQSTYQSEKLKGSITQDIEKATKDSGYVYISREFVNNMQREMRQAEVNLAKARADLQTDPVAQFIANMNESRMQQMKTALDQSQALAREITTNFQGITGVTDIDKILSGMDYRSRSAATDPSGKRVFKPGTDIKKGIISMLESGGYSKEEMLKSFDDAVKEALNDLEGIAPQTKAGLEKVAERTRSILSAAIDQQAIKNIQEMRNFRENVEQRRAYVVGLRDRLVGGQLDAIKEAIRMVGSADPLASSRVEILESVRQATQGDQTLREIQNAFYKQFAPDGPGTNASADAEFKKFEAAFKNNQNTLFRVQIQNIIRTAKEAREKAIAELRTNASELTAQNAELQKELYIYTGDTSYLSGALQSDTLRITADTDAKIAKLEERVRQIRQGIQANRSLAGMGLQALPDLQVPAIQTDPATQTHRINVETKLDAINNSIQSLKASNPAGGGVSLNSLPRFAQTGAPSLGYANLSSAMPVAGSLPEYAKALLNAIASVESGGSYNIRYGGKAGPQYFDDFSQHPRLYAMGPAGPSSAAGRYQFTASTWDSLGGGAFTPENQDAKAWQLAQQRYRQATGRDLATDLQSGGLTSGMMSALAPTWAGLGANPSKAMANYMSTYGGAGGASWSTNTSQSGAKPDTDAINRAKDAQQGLNDILEKYSLIKDTNITNEKQLADALKAHGASSDEVTRATELYRTSTQSLEPAQRKELDLLTQNIELQKKLRDAKIAAANTPAGQYTTQMNYEMQQNEQWWQTIQKGASAADGITYAFRKMRAEVQSDGQIAATAFASFTGGIADVLAGVITGTEKDWKQATANILRSIAQVILKALIMRALSGIGGWFGLGSQDGNGFLGGNLLSMNGNAFVGGGRVEHRNGGLVHSMQTFRMANGGVASMSEIGTEAILPLMRGRGGKLGVAMYPDGYQQNGANTAQVPIARGGGGGGGTQVVFSPQYNFQSGPGEQQQNGGSVDKDQMRQFQRDLDRETQAAVMRVVDQQSRPGGALHGPTRKYNQGSSI